MKILYDYQAFSNQDFGGVSKCFCELISNRPKGMDYEISVLQSNNVHLKHSNLVPNLLPAKLNYKIFKKRFNIKGSLKIYHLMCRIAAFHTSEHENKQASIEALRKGDFDVFHPTYFHPYFLDYIGNKPYVLTVHDLISELYFGDKNGDSQNKRKTLQGAAHIIAVSQYTKDDLVRIYDVDPNKVSVVYHGTPNNMLPVNEEKQIGNYYLYVGNRSSYKKFIPFLEQAADFFHNHPDIHLECTGSPFTKDEVEVIKKLGLEKQVTVNFVDEQKLMKLYSSAIGFIYPSEYEGFGMPILEAFSLGCPVLLNNKSCFPEIGGNAAIYFDLNDNHSLAEKMEKLFSLTAEQRKLIVDKGFQRTKLFSWQESAKQLASIYEKIISK